MKIADLFFKASLDDSRLEVDARKSGAKAGAAAAQGYKANWSSALKQGIGLGIATTGIQAAGAAIGAVTDFMGDAIESASNLNESLSKSDVVFGDNARAIEAWADDSAEAFGQSKQQALEAVSTYGNLFQAFGETADNSAMMSKRLVELAADLASFNNTSVDDALVALRSGLSGETEPLKRYGIAINDARLRSVLMAKGIKNLGATLTPLQKAQAAYTLILKDSTLAQGDFARTSDGLANQQRIVAAELENTRAEVGEKLIPVQLQWEKGNLDLIRSLDALNDVTHAGEVPREKMVTDIDSLIRTLDPSRGLLGNFATGQIDAAEATLEAAEAAKEQNEAIGHTRGAAKAAQAGIDDLGDSTNDLATETHRAGTTADTLAGFLHDLGYEADKTDDAVGDLATTIATELFGDAINAGNEARLKESIQDLEKQRRETTKGSPKWKELTGEIAENEQSLFDLHLEQAKSKGPEAVIDFLQQEKSQLRKSDSAARKYIDDLIRLYQLMTRYSDLGVISFGRYTGKTIPGFASGGHYEAGVPRIVGEHGIELDIPDHSGTIYPDVSAAVADMAGIPTASNSWASSMDITLNVDARGTTNPAATGTAVRQGVHDAMADVLRQQTARLPTGTRS